MILPVFPLIFRYFSESLFFRIISNLKISLLINLSRLITNIMLFLFLSTFSYLSKFNSNLVYSAHEVGLNVLSLGLARNYLSILRIFVKDYLLKKVYSFHCTAHICLRDSYLSRDQIRKSKLQYFLPCNECRD